ncbi:hypothetical protein JTB14_012130 [Gonioctena quinquepunctata]|nr:hypothetical protein JTB14_012130 [Gonioctena quinquepunctata]
MYLELEPLKYSAVCVGCNQYFKKVSPNIPLKTQAELFSVPLQNHITYSCIWKPWGCSESHNPQDILKHEKNCLHQPSRLCPVSFCNNRCKLSDMRNHFEVVHPNDQIYLFPRTKVLLTAETSQKWYIWAYHDFISLEVSFDSSSSQYEVRVIPHDSEENTKLQPIVLFFTDAEISSFAKVGLPCRITASNSIYCSFH